LQESETIAMSVASMWGTDFKESGGLDGTQVKLRIARLANYIKSRQAR